MNTQFAVQQRCSTRPPSALVVSGLIELAVGVLSGWVYAAVVEQPATMRRVGVRAPNRIRQWHLELMMAGAFNVVCGLAVPNAGRGTTVALAAGSWINPNAFLPLAFNTRFDKSRPAYVFPVVGGLAATSFGYVGIAVVAARSRIARRRRCLE
ncbi:hypothetical protein [Mycobacterium sp. DBP42]|uniref:hypothetical protein n=1 Tax=Mycobacterium sp. DBP42 TaxID=2545267 RepID=UPI00110C9C03|nr:hypothetical protein [Mycobacterium sp. DBP42]TMS51147.1 hypothetical protein E0T84_20665 [Mycobacterium sp. DBP42]